MTELQSIFCYLDYKSYLRMRLEGASSSTRGLRSRIAERLGCQCTYVSQVLNKDAHFSLEQADKINEFLEHPPLEANYFLLMIQHARAGTQSLRKHFEVQMQRELARSQELKERLQISDDISPNAREIYYSKWYYSAIHVLVSIEKFQTVEALQEILHLSRNEVIHVLDFLTTVGFVEKTGLHYCIGKKTIHIPHDSPFVAKHHVNWRFETLAKLNRNDIVDSEDFFYTSAITLSHSDVSRIKRMILDEVQAIKGIVRNSKEEVAYSFCIDFHHLTRC
jgi:uncharacterized protein (TIGR02147 family)